MASNRQGGKGRSRIVAARPAAKRPERWRCSAQEVGDAAQAGVRLLIETIALQIPLDTDEEELITNLVAIARGSGGMIAPAQLGDLFEAHLLMEHIRHPRLTGSDDDREIGPAAQFDYGSCGRHTLTRPLMPPFGKMSPALVPTIHCSRIESEAAT